MQMHSRPKPKVSIQVDLDGLWAIKRVYGVPVTSDDNLRDPVYALGLSWFLDNLKQRGIRATFFAVGSDCEVPFKADLLRRAVEEGHEVANHTYSHRLALGQCDRAVIREEIVRASDAIERATGRRPVGLRTPGFDASPAILQEAVRAGLQYDASLLPTRISSALRFVAGCWSHGSKGEKAAGGVSGHYGSGPVWRAPLRPYYPDVNAPWRAVDHAPIYELPVGVTPVLRLPIHASVAMVAGWRWTRCALSACARSGHGTLTYVMHGVDVVAPDDLRGLPKGVLANRLFWRSRESKIGFIERILDFLTARFEPILGRDAVVDRSDGKT
jgi:hypothetical protein